MDLERRLLSFVAARHGIVTRAEARELGYSSSAIDRRIEQGLWIPVFRRVYRVASVPRSYEQDVLAAAIVARGAAAMRTAIRLHGLHGYDGNLVETISATTWRPRSGRFIFHHTDRLPDCDLVHVGPIPITTPTRTLVELGAALPPNLVEVALDSALRQGKTSLPGLHRKLAERCGSGHSGAGVLRRLLDERPDGGVPESPLETRFRRILISRGVPQPVAQFIVEEDGRFIARLDFAYPDLKVAIECQSYEWYSGHQNWEKDIERHNRLQSLGWIIVYVTWEDLQHRPNIVAERVRVALCRASPVERGSG